MRTQIAIDPDLDKNGVAVWRGDKIEVKSLSFPALLDFLKENSDAHVVVEAGWLNKKSNVHGYHGAVAERISKSVGINHGVGLLIVQMCNHYKISVSEKKPLRKVWRGKNGKITQGEIEYFIDEFPKRSNQEERDAALILWLHIGRRVKIKPKTTSKLNKNAFNGGENIKVR